MKILLTSKNKINMFNNWISLLKTINPEISLIFTKDYIKVNSMDPGKIILINTIFKKLNFDYYEPPEKDLELFLNLGELYERLKSVEEDETLSIEYDNILNKFIIKFYKSDTERLRIFRMAPINYSIPYPDLPEIKPTTELSLMISDFDRAISDCALVSETIIFKTIKEEAETLHIIAEGETGDAEIKISGFEGKLLEDSLSVYTIDYLRDIINPLKQLTSILTLSFSTDDPLQITVDSQVDLFELSIYLAAIIK